MWIVSSLCLLPAVGSAQPLPLHVCFVLHRPLLRPQEASGADMGPVLTSPLVRETSLTSSLLSKSRCLLRCNSRTIKGPSSNLQPSGSSMFARLCGITVCNSRCFHPPKGKPSPASPAPQPPTCLRPLPICLLRTFHSKESTCSARACV
uniref:Secreted protein n=1 Tax=Myotis myotis TaxID=51298 RepID=A0A7J8AM31_MYOMY|nr:hypothetical protein mMyoMyo1_007801 [Myotis myotis]